MLHLRSFCNNVAYMNYTGKYTCTAIAMLLLVSFLTSCSNDDTPPIENEGEIINKVTLTFISSDSTLSFSWFDEDGEGTEQPTIDEIVLLPNTPYELGITFENTIAGEDITGEIQEEGHEHQIYFGFTVGLFSDPTGNGNIENQAGVVDYEDMDENSLPIGLITQWTTGEQSEGEFRSLLKNQAGIKSGTGSSSDCTSDVDITFALSIAE
jgi:hypothetical protein